MFFIYCSVTSSGCLLSKSQQKYVRSKIVESNQQQGSNWHHCPKSVTRVIPTSWWTRGERRGTCGSCRRGRCPWWWCRWLGPASKYSSSSEKSPKNGSMMKKKRRNTKRERSQLLFEILSKILRRCSRPVGLLVTVDKSSVTREKINSCQICHKIAQKVKNPNLGL